MTLRLPTRLRNRWVYAAVAGVSGAVFLTAFVLIAGSFGTPDPGDLRAGLLGFLGAPAAALCWPRGGRSARRMFVAGLLTVLLSIVLFVLLATLVTIYENPSSTHIARQLSEMPYFMAGAVIFGTLFTFGIPYLLGGSLSVLFADNPSEPPQ